MLHEAGRGSSGTPLLYVGGGAPKVRYLSLVPDCRKKPDVAVAAVRQALSPNDQALTPDHLQKPHRIHNSAKSLGALPFGKLLLPHAEFLGELLLCHFQTSSGASNLRRQ